MYKNITMVKLFLRDRKPPPFFFSNLMYTQNQFGKVNTTNPKSPDAVSSRNLNYGGSIKEAGKKLAEVTSMSGEHQRARKAAGAHLCSAGGGHPNRSEKLHHRHDAAPLHALLLIRSMKKRISFPERN